MISSHRVLDAHVHLQPSWMTKPDVRTMFQAGRSDIKELEAFESDPARFERHLDAEGIDAAVLVNYVSPVVMGYTPESNAWVTKYAQGRPRLIPMGSVHPDVTPDVAAETRRILDLGVRVLKVHPAHQLLYPNDPRLDPLYDIAEERGVPVTIHTGTSVFPRAKNRFTDPIFVDDVAVDHPGLRILLAHAGRPLWYESASFVARRHANVMLELSGIPPKKLLDVLPRLADMDHKCVWGSDWPSMGVRSMRQNVEQFLALPLSDRAKGRILWENGAALLGLRATG